MDVGLFPPWVTPNVIAIGMISLTVIVIFAYRYRVKLIGSATWNTVKLLGDSRIKESAFAAVVFIPIFYQFILRPIKIVGDWLAQIGLPNGISHTTLKVVVVGGVIVVIGRMVYQFQCPKFIKENNAGDVQKYEKNEAALPRTFAELIQTEKGNVRPRDIVMSVTHFAEVVDAPLSESQVSQMKTQPDTAIDILSRLTVPEEKRADAFLSIYEFANRTRPATRLACMGLYIVGGSLVFYPYVKRLISFLLS